MNKVKEQLIEEKIYRKIMRKYAPFNFSSNLVANQAIRVWEYLLQAAKTHLTISWPGIKLVNLVFWNNNSIYFRYSHKWNWNDQQLCSIWHTLLVSSDKWLLRGSVIISDKLASTQLALLCIVCSLKSALGQPTSFFLCNLKNSIIFQKKLKYLNIKAPRKFWNELCI